MPPFFFAQSIIATLNSCALYPSCIASFIFSCGNIPNRAKLFSLAVNVNHICAAFALTVLFICTPAYFVCRARLDCYPTIYAGSFTAFHALDKLIGCECICKKIDDISDRAFIKIILMMNHCNVTVVPGVMSPSCDLIFPTSACSRRRFYRDSLAGVSPD